ncbi:MAG: hypothetical protein AB8H79_01385, partial [Myxococcota bacterium]
GNQVFSVHDVDGDGESELWLREDWGLVSVVRKSALGPVLERAMQVSFSLEGAPWFASGVDRADALWFSNNGDLCWTP